MQPSEKATKKTQQPSAVKIPPEVTSPSFGGILNVKRDQGFPKKVTFEWFWKLLNVKRDRKILEVTLWGFREPESLK